MPAQRYLITGATGFLGRHVLQHLAEQHPQARAVALLRTPSAWQEQDWAAGLTNVDVVAGGLMDDLGQRADLGELDGIFHLAALVRHSRSDSEEVYRTNIDGTLQMVRLAAAKRCRLIYVSTSGTVGVFNSRREWADEHSVYREQEVAAWPYYDSKVKAERAARKLADELGVELVIMRPPVLLGPGDHRFRSTGNIIRYLRRKLPFLIRGGMHFIDIRDASAAMVRAMQRESIQPVYHLSGVACSLDSFFKMVENASGVEPPKMHLPYGLALIAARSASGLAGLLPGHVESPLPDPVVVEMAGKYWDVRSRYAVTDLAFVNRPGQETINDTVDWLYAHHPKLKRSHEGLNLASAPATVLK